VIYCFWLPLWYFGHCIVCPLIYGFWLPLWYFSHCIVCLLFTALDYPLWYFGHCIVCLWFTAFDYPFGILVIVLSVCDLRLLITPLVFWSLYCLSVNYSFWLALWYFGHCIVCLWFTAFDYPFGILVIVLSVCDLRLLITPLVCWSLYCLSFDLSFWLPIWYFCHCMCLSVIYGFWLPLWYVGHCIVCLWFTACDYPIGILVIVLSVCDLRLLITPLVFWSLYCLSVIYAFDYPFGILVIVLYVCELRLLITPLVFWSLYCLSVNYGFWLPLWYFGHCIVCPVIYGFWLPLWYFGHCIVCPLICSFWLSLWYFGHCIVCLWFTAFDFPFGILVIVLSLCDLLVLITPLVFWSLQYLSFELLLLITPLVFWSLYCLSFELRLLITALVFWSLYCQSFDLLLLITPLVFWSLDCLSVIYGFWSPDWYISHCIVCLWFTAFDYPFGILVIGLSVRDLRLLITPLVY
jgi:hypothetical protein